MSTSTVSLRRAGADDGPAFLDLVRALAAYERLAPPDAEAGRRLLADAFGPRPRFEVTLAWADGVPAGYAVTFETYSTFLARPTLYLEDLFVLPDRRGQGIGRALFTHCAREAAARRCGRMEWQVLDWNEPALEFYARLGARRLDGWSTFRLDAADLERAAAG